MFGSEAIRQLLPPCPACWSLPPVKTGSKPPVLGNCTQSAVFCSVLKLVLGRAALKTPVLASDYRKRNACSEDNLRNPTGVGGNDKIRNH